MGKKTNTDHQVIVAAYDKPRLIGSGKYQIQYDFLYYCKSQLIWQLSIIKPLDKEHLRNGFSDLETQCMQSGLQALYKANPSVDGESPTIYRQSYVSMEEAPKKKTITKIARKIVSSDSDMSQPVCHTTGGGCHY